MSTLCRLYFRKKVISLNLKLVFYSFLVSCSNSFGELPVNFLKGIDDVMSEIESGGNLTYGVLALRSGVVHKIRAKASAIIEQVDVSNFDDTACFNVLLLTTRALFPVLSIDLSTDSDNPDGLTHYLRMKQFADLINCLYSKQGECLLPDGVPNKLVNVWNNIVGGIEMIKLHNDNNVANDVFYLINQVILACAWKHANSVENIEDFIKNLHSDFKNGNAYNPLSVWTIDDIAFLKGASDVRYYAQYLAVIAQLENDFSKKILGECVAKEDELRPNELTFEILIYKLIRILITKVGYDSLEATFPKLNIKCEKFRAVEDFFNRHRVITSNDNYFNKLVEEKWVAFLKSLCGSNLYYEDILCPSFENLYKVFSVIIGDQCTKFSREKICKLLCELMSILAGPTKNISASMQSNMLNINIFDVSLNERYSLRIAINGNVCSLTNYKPICYYIERKQNILDETIGIAEVMNYMLCEYDFNNHPIWTLFFAPTYTYINKVCLLYGLLENAETVYLPAFVANLINSIDWEAYNAEIRRIDAVDIFNNILNSRYWQDDRFLSNLKTWYMDGMAKVDPAECLQKLPNLEYLLIRQSSFFKDLSPLSDLSHLKWVTLFICQDLESLSGLECMPQVHVQTCWCKKLVN